jgi:hypothetical protein
MQRARPSSTRTAVGRADEGTAADSEGGFRFDEDARAAVTRKTTEAYYNPFAMLFDSHWLPAAVAAGSGHRDAPAFAAG